MGDVLTHIGWDGLAAISTAALVITAVWQLSAIRAEAKKERTLSICGRFISDEHLLQSMRRIATADLDGELDESPERFRDDIITILNYFNIIAIGVYHKVYADKLVRAHLQAPMIDVVKRCLAPAMVEKVSLEPSYFSSLVALTRNWTADDDGEK